MLSPFHYSSMVMVKTRSGQQDKPAVITDYNKNMGAVDMADQMLQSYQVERKKRNSGIRAVSASAEQDRSQLLHLVQEV